MSAIAGIRMKNPAHPGGFVKSEIIEPLGLSVTTAAQVLGVTRATLSTLLNEHPLHLALIPARHLICCSAAYRRCWKEVQGGNRSRGRAQLLCYIRGTLKVDAYTSLPAT